MSAHSKLWFPIGGQLKRRAPVGGVIEVPPPDPQTTVFGVCPISSDGQSQAASSVASKWTTKASPRLFFGATLTQTPKPTNPRVLMHVSAKPPNNITDAQIDAWLTYYAGHLVTFWHESDNDTGYTGTDATSVANRNARIALQNRLYDRNVALGRPCRVVVVFVGTFWSNSTPDSTRNLWMNTLKGDLIGLDHDGVHDKHTSPPPDGITYYANTGSQTSSSNKMTPELRLANINRYLSSRSANGWQGFCVPELGTSVAPWDTTGAGRKQWIQDCTELFVDAGAVAIHYYDDRVGTADDVLYVGKADRNYWQTKINSNAEWTGW